MSDINELHDYENRPKKKNPFRGRPIPKSRIEWAIRSTLSITDLIKQNNVRYQEEITTFKPIIEEE